MDKDYQPHWVFDIEVYDTSESEWAQAKYLAHGHDDCLWTYDIGDALSFLRTSLELISK